jgi:energy-coupling factor transporter ATP-binding protein EcfA2
MDANTSELVESSDNKKKNSKSGELLAWLIPQVNFIRSIEGQNYISFNDQPHKALNLGGERSEAISAISNRYLAMNNRWLQPNEAKMLADYLHAQCRITEPVEVALRAAYRDGAIYVDQGDQFWSVYRIDKNGHQLVDDCPVIFTRSTVTSALPDLTGVKSDLELFRKYVNLDRDGFYTLIGCIAGSYFTHFPQPLIFINGPAGTGKSTLARMLGDLMDKSTGTPGANLTKDERDLKARAKARRVMSFENVSFIHNEISDILARITTGTEISPRALYTNDESHVTLLKRPVIINGILEGFARSDLASRAFSFELSPFAGNARLRDRELNQAWQQDFPAILAGLFEVISMVLRNIETVKLEDQDIHRNIDLLEVLQCISDEFDCDTHSFVKGSSKSLAYSVLDGCPVGESLRGWIQCDLGESKSCNWDKHQKITSGTFTTKELRSILLRHLDEGMQNKFPEDERSFGLKLKRVQTALEEAFGITIKKYRSNAQMNYKFIEVKQVLS